MGFDSDRAMEAVILNTRSAIHLLSGTVAGKCVVDCITRQLVIPGERSHEDPDETQKGRV